MPRPIPDGTTHAVETEITPDMGVRHLGPSAAVLSTPSMISLMERAALEAMRPHLEPGENSVGTKVCVSHLAAARVGDRVRTTAAFEAMNGRRSTWRVEVRKLDGTLIGEGTHERAVIDQTRFATQG